MPRPLLLYTTRVADAHDWWRLLRDAGYRRVALVTGPTSADDRQRAIEGLTGRDMLTGRAGQTTVDVVVATSAFGLGIDQPDIRSIIHACVPETVDRFYQEVGRAGRDGNAAMSLVLYTEDDYQTARAMSRTRLISVDRAFERWEAMRNSAEDVFADGSLLVPLDARPSDLGLDSEHNHSWNLRTLTLMSRAGMIELVGKDPRRDQTAASESGAVPGGNWVPVHLIHGSLSDRTWFEDTIRASRKKTHASDEESWRLMGKLLTAGIDVAHILQEAYAVEASLEDGAEIAVIPQPSCGGCPSCRRDARPPYTGVLPRPGPVRCPMEFADETLSGLVDGLPREVLLVTYDATAYARQADWFELAERVAIAAVRHGVRAVIAPPDLLARREIGLLHRRCLDGFVFLDDRYIPGRAPDIPTLIVHPWGISNADLVLDYLFEAPGIPMRLVLVPSDLPDPERLHERAAVMNPSVQVEALLATL
jgi:hypothetical protein